MRQARRFRCPGACLQDSKLWQALDSILDNMLLDAVNDVSDPKNDVTKFAHAAGRVDAISGIKSRLEEYK